MIGDPMTGNDMASEPFLRKRFGTHAVNVRP
jgi:hypothetical protein